MAHSAQFKRIEPPLAEFVLANERLGQLQRFSHVDLAKASFRSHFSQQLEQGFLIFPVGANAGTASVHEFAA
jgi:hypothetical protein